MRYFALRCFTLRYVTLHWKTGYLWNGDDECHGPRCQDHFSSPRRTGGGSEFERPRNDQVPVDTHGGQYEGRAGQCHDLDVENTTAGSVTEDPRLLVDHEQNLRRHGEEADSQVPGGKVDEEDVDASVQRPVFGAWRQDDDEGDVADKRHDHDEREGR